VKRHPPKGGFLRYDTTLRQLTGVRLLLTPIAFNLLFTLLSVTFEYPDILREPAGYVLERFDAGGL
jgi:hypothetical protein